MPRLSIVIPCLGGAEAFETTLASVLQNRPADCEVLVVHRGAYDDPYALAGEVCFVRAEEETLAAQMNFALRYIRGGVVHFLGCGLEATEGWTDPVWPHFAHPEVAAVAPLIWTPDRRAVVAAGVGWSAGGRRVTITDPRVTEPGQGRLRASILGPTLAAAFYRREVLCALDGFDTRLPDELADIELALALRDLELRSACEPACRVIQSQPPAHLPATRRSLAFGLEHLFWRSVPRPLDPAALACHGLSAAAAVLDPLLRARPHHAMAELTGRAVAVGDLAGVRRHRTRLARAAQRLDDVATLRARRQQLERLAVEESTSPADQRRAA